jgi:hypothetical protein
MVVILQVHKRPFVIVTGNDNILSRPKEFVKRKNEGLTCCARQTFVFSYPSSPREGEKRAKMDGGATLHHPFLPILRKDAQKQAVCKAGFAKKRLQ